MRFRVLKTQIFWVQKCSVSLHMSEEYLRKSQACGFTWAYHLSWRFACVRLAQLGLNAARSLWQDMSWAFACARCFVYAELLMLEVKSGWLLQVASFATLIPLGLKGVCSKWLPESWVLISATHDASPWAGIVRVKGRSAHFQWHSLQGKCHARPEETQVRQKQNKKHNLTHNS